MGSAGTRGRPAYVPTVNENLYEPLSAEAEREYREGQGDELRRNIRAVHSSSALCCNLFHYWKSRACPVPIAAACGVLADLTACIRFEALHPITDNPDRAVFPRDPNPDVEFTYPANAGHRAVAFECKFGEPYDSRIRQGLKPAYLGLPGLWDGLSNCRELAEHICPDDREFSYLHAAQILKHILGLRRTYGLGGFVLVYLWYDVPGGDGWNHRSEVDRLADIVRKDGVNLHTVTYQQAILNLARDHHADHAEYTNYVAERYL